MDILFDRGSKDQPKGHALVYFRSSADPEEVWVSYLVVLPVTVDLSKYVPPFLMNQVGELGAKELSCFAFPPAPERLGSYSIVERMAAMRDDDILFAGTLNTSDIPAAMMSMNEVVQRYAEMYSQVAPESGQGEQADEAEPAELGVSEVLYGLMSQSDKLGELTRLVGRLRFAVEGSDASLIKEAEEGINLLATHLPENHDIPQLLEAVKSSESAGTELANLYLQRCYHLVQEDYGKMGQIEEQIRELERGTSIE